MTRLAGLLVAGAFALAMLPSMPADAAPRCVAPPATSKKCAEWKCAKAAWCTPSIGFDVNACLKWKCAFVERRR